MRNRIAVPLTTNFRLFLGISGFIYALWGISAFSVQLAIIINSISSYYSGFWSAVFLIVGGIIMMVAACRSAYPLQKLTVNYILNLSFCTIGLIFAIVNYTITSPCSVTSFWYCDSSLSGHLRIALLVLFILALIHTIINMIVVSKEHKRALSKTHPSLASY